MIGLNAARSERENRFRISELMRTVASVNSQLKVKSHV